ncbi:MAG: EF-hand domain-containing protein [Candidatus Sericytochromatia bacterium]|nr:EF-hand domain-containing protein [Candidatus Sericytochromatia bacterium]
MPDRFFMTARSAAQAAALNWSLMNTNHDDQLTLNELSPSASSAQAFQEMDADGNQRVTYPEYQRYYIAFLVNMTLQGIRSGFIGPPPAAGQSVPGAVE